MTYHVEQNKKAEKKNEQLRQGPGRKRDSDPWQTNEQGG